MMPIFKDYSENGELLQTRDEPLSADNLDRFVKENGIDKALGYLEALSDITKQIDQSRIKRTYPSDTTGLDRYTVIYHSETIFQKKILAIQEEKKNFLAFAKKVIEVKKQDGNSHLAV